MRPQTRSRQADQAPAAGRFVCADERGSLTGKRPDVGKVDFTIDVSRERYPFCVVWTPLPLLTWCVDISLPRHRLPAASPPPRAQRPRPLLPAASRGSADSLIRPAQDLPLRRAHGHHGLGRHHLRFPRSLLCRHGGQHGVRQPDTLHPARSGQDQEHPRGKNNKQYPIKLTPVQWTPLLRACWGLPSSSPSSSSSAAFCAR
jgi:hypothetical protein